MDTKTLEKVKEKIERISVQGHGEVIVKIKNGHIWRILATEDELLDKNPE